MSKETKFTEISRVMDRRDFIKSAIAASSAAALASCKNGSVASVTSASGTGPMTMRQDAHGDSVSLLGYGCMRWPSEQEDINRLVDRALEAGVNYFDTAPVYGKGQNETVTGIALARHPRSSYKIATKLSNFAPETHSFEGSVAMYRNSFKALQTDYIDYYLLHGVGRSIEQFNARFVDNGMLDFLMGERKAGRIRNLGFSFHGALPVLDQVLALHEKYHWDFVQIQMNYVDWKNAMPHAENLYTHLANLGIPVVIMEPILGGRLAQVPQHIATKFQQRRPADSPARWAFRFCGSFPGVLTVLSGMTYMEHLEDNLATFSSLEPLSDSEMSFLDEISEVIAKFPVVPCTACSYCMPCPYGIDIPGLFAHYNKCVNEGYVNPNPESAEYRKARRKYLTSYVKAVAASHAADKCIGCEMCIEKCPQGIKIPREIRKIDNFVETLRRQK